MGYVKIKAKISNTDRTKSKELELIADTGAIYTAIPENILKSLDIMPKGKRRFKIADGKIKEFKIGEAYIEIGKEGATSIVAFLEENAMPLLGVTTLELLGLQVDPVSGELKPLELFML